MKEGGVSVVLGVRPVWALCGISTTLSTTWSLNVASMDRQAPKYPRNQSSSCPLCPKGDMSHAILSTTWYYLWFPWIDMQAPCRARARYSKHHEQQPMSFHMHIHHSVISSVFFLECMWVKSSSSLVLLMGAAKRATAISAQVWNDPGFTAQLTWLQSSQTPLY